MSTVPNGVLPVTTQQLENILRVAYKNKQKILIVSEPGGGKTTICKYIAAEMNFRLKYAHPVKDAPEDIKGYPCLEEGVGRFKPFGDWHDLAITKVPTVLLIDDFGLATKPVMGSYMQLLGEHRIGEIVLSDEVVIVACTNSNKHKSGVEGILDAVKKRFHSILYLQPTMDGFVSWGTKNGIEEVVIGYAKMRPDLFDKYEPTMDIINGPCARTMEYLSEIVKAGYRPCDLQALFVGAIGPEFGNEFFHVYKFYTDFVDPREVLRNPMTTKLPTNLSAVYAVVSALVKVVDTNNFGAFIQYLMRIADYHKSMDYVIFGVMMATNKKPDLCKTAAYVKFKMDHAELETQL